jgi:hypothetical protein
VPALPRQSDTDAHGGDRGPRGGVSGENTGARTIGLMLARALTRKADCSCALPGVIDLVYYRDGVSGIVRSWRGNGVFPNQREL